MRIALVTTFAALTALTACGDDGGTPATIDAPGGAAVARVACAGATVTATVTAPSFAFTPQSTTITAGQIVQFSMPSAHNAVSDTGAFTAGFSADTCFQFNTAGSYPFHCEPHLFTGTVVVQ